MIEICLWWHRNSNFGFLGHQLQTLVILFKITFEIWKVYHTGENFVHYFSVHDLEIHILQTLGPAEINNVFEIENGQLLAELWRFEVGGIEIRLFEIFFSEFFSFEKYKNSLHIVQRYSLYNCQNCQEWECDKENVEKFHEASRRIDVGKEGSVRW